MLLAIQAAHVSHDSGCHVPATHDVKARVFSGKTLLTLARIGPYAFEFQELAVVLTPGEGCWLYRIPGSILNDGGKATL